jgi:hypothetical protein
MGDGQEDTKPTQLGERGDEGEREERGEREEAQDQREKKLLGEITVLTQQVHTI